MKNSFILKIMLAILMAIFIAGTANAQVSLSFLPGNSTIGLNDTARLGVMLTDPINVRTIQLTVDYDDSILTSLGGGQGAAYDLLPGPPFPIDGFDDTSVAGQWTGFAVSIGPS